MVSPAGRFRAARPWLQPEELTRQAERLQGTCGDGFSRLSKSTINRRFVRVAKAVVTQLQSRPLGGERSLAIYLDGIVEQGHHVTCALGLTANGKKRVLGLREGSLIDGGKGLASALKEFFA